MMDLSWKFEELIEKIRLQQTYSIQWNMAKTHDYLQFSKLIY